MKLAYKRSRSSGTNGFYLILKVEAFMLAIAKKLRQKTRELKKSFMAYMINDRINHTFGRGTAYFSWKERILVVLLLTVLFAIVLLMIIYYPTN